MTRIVTYSELSTLFLCPRQHELSFVRMLTPIKRNIRFDEGTASHEAMDTFYRGGTIEEAITSFDRTYDEHVLHLKGIAKDDPENMKKVIERFLRTRALVVVYLETVGMKDRKEYNFDHVEGEFLVPILDPDGREVPGILFAGKIDGIWSRKKGRKIPMVVEHKFYSSWNETENTLSMDLQVTLYALASKTAFGVNVPVTLYNVCRKPGNKMKEGESPEEFFDRMVDTVRDPKNGPFFYRTPVTRGPAHFSAARDVLYWGAMIVLGKHPLPYRYRNVGDHCLWRCPFGQICIEENPRMVEAFYQKKEKLHPELKIEEEIS